MLDALDPHQEQGVRRAVRILEQQNGVMVCDGVGLGKSFIALALLGFDPMGDADEETPQKLQEKRELVQRLCERADVLVIDESHNFRSSSASRYKNLLERPGRFPLIDAGEILILLAQTVPGAQSGVPSDEAQLAQRLKKLKETVRNQFSEISLPATIQPKLVCWLELRKGNVSCPYSNPLCTPSMIAPRSLRSSMTNSIGL